jgi:hypothetical protein
MRMVIRRIQRRAKPKNHLLEARRVRTSQRKSCVMMIVVNVRSEGLTAAEDVAIFLGYQPRQYHQTLMMGTEMVRENSIIFNQLTWLIAREYFINMIAALASGLARIAAWRSNILRFLHSSFFGSKCFRIL